MDRPTIILMAKAPEPGRVKTRLTTRLTPAQAAAVHAACIRATTERLADLDADRVVVCFDPPDSLDGIRQDVDGRIARFVPQTKGDLGTRMAQAVEDVAAAGPVLIVGCDSPDLPDEFLRRAVESLNDVDVVLGPTDDGGYWCVGLGPGVDARKLFAGVPWSSGRERDATVANAGSMNRRVKLADPYFDLDHPADLDALVDRLSNRTDARSLALLGSLQAVCPTPTAARSLA